MSQLTQRLAQLSPELRAQLMKQVKGRAASPSLQAILPIARESETFPLSFAQQRFWFIEQVEPGNAAYHIATAIRLEGTIQLALLEQSFTHLLRRHESLRTTFHLHQGQPVQVIHPAAPFAIPLVDLRALPGDERMQAGEQVMEWEAQQPFSLEQGPLLRARLCQLGEHTYILMLTTHHIIADGWSMSILVQEVTAHYAYVLQGRAPVLPDLPIQYVDYTLWQRSTLQGDVLQQQLEYWRTRLADAPVLELPTDHARPARRTYRGALTSCFLPTELVRALRQVSQQEQATLMMTMLAAFGILLARYTNQQDLVVGMPIANRVQPEVEHLVGLFLNTLALRLDLSEDPSFLQMLRRVRETCLSADARQDIPFEKLVEELQPQRSLSHAPFFQVMFIPQNQPAAPFDLPGLRVQSLRPDRQAAMFDLSLYIFEQDQDVEVCAEYNTDLFSRATIVRLLHQYTNLLQGGVATPGENIWRLPLLTAHERQCSLVAWNATRRSFAARRSVHGCVEAQVEKSPDAVAVSFEQDSHLTYSALEQRSNQLAHALQRRGVRPGCLVGMLLERSLDMVVGLLGSLKAGGAYIPLDPQYPLERLAYIVQSSGLQLLLTQERLRQRPGPQPGLQIVTMEGDYLSIAREKSTRPPCEATEEDLAYVIYTSGSTGKPKGVQIPHAAVVNFLCSMREQPGLDARDMLLAVTTIAFDIAALEIFLPLTTGARVMLLSRESVLDGRVLATALLQSCATVMQATPATWRLLLDAGWQGKAGLKILCGGEALTRDLANQLVQKGATLWNLYGPTETTIWSTVCQVEAADGPVSIGRPIANTQVYVLDAFLAPVPSGVAGEIYIGGAGVARGYLHRAELTRERFLADPFQAGHFLYRTGDRGYYQPDGSLYYQGRNDQQIKLRGFRIETGEIEAVLTSHPAVQAAVVVVREDTPGSPYLVAYLLGEKTDSGELRAWLKRHVPEYMLPAAYVFLTAFPLTPNGKIDRRALPAPDALLADETLEAPRTESEHSMLTAWRHFLGRTEIGIQQNFFDLGGHSLIAPQLLAHINQTFQVDLPLRAFLAAPTIAGLTQLIADTQAGKPLAVPAAVDLQAEVALDAEIRPRRRSPLRPGHTGSILLTGATGFLGVYLLAELLQHTQATIYCLLRAPTVDEGCRKLQRCLQAHQLWDAATAHRVVPVCGDLAQPLLGLSAREFAWLAEKIDSLYHCGAWVNFTYPYQILKASNVLGTQEVLRLAGQAGAPVHFISTLGVFALKQYPAHTRLREQTPLQESYGLEDGYTQSKWVAEKMLELARSRGCTVSIYRPGTISGHSQTGIGNTTDLVWAILKGCIQLGSAPELEWPINLVPVDYVSQAIIHLSLQQERPAETFHFFHTQTLCWNRLVQQARSFGYSLHPLPFARWREEMLAELGRPAADNALQPFLPLLAKWRVDGAAQAPVMFDDQQTQAGLRGSAITRPDLDERLLETYLSYFVRSGFLPAPAGNRS
jgi:amino acid adenylation domain-containing protein/thioester reductase-like protein